jgi:hypothetical protein
MRHLFGGVAIAALLAAGLPAAAQTSSTDQQNAPAAAPSQSAPMPKGDMQHMKGMSNSGTSEAAKPGVKKSAKMPGHHRAAKAKTHEARQALAHKRGGRAPEDNMAEELNRQELQRVSQGAQTPGSGTSAPGGAMQGQPAPKQ